MIPEWHWEYREDLDHVPHRPWNRHIHAGIAKRNRWLHRDTFLPMLPSDPLPSGPNMHHSSVSIRRHNIPEVHHTVPLALCSNKVTKMALRKLTISSNVQEDMCQLLANNDPYVIFWSTGNSWNERFYLGMLISIIKFFIALVLANTAINYRYQNFNTYKPLDQKDAAVKVDCQRPPARSR